MAASAIDLEDFTCSICREIYQVPVSLSCAHCYCRSCLPGLKKSPTSSSADLPPIPVTPTSSSTLIYKPKTYEANQCFVCAICRKDSMGYLECRDLESDLKTLETPCPHCSKSMMLCDLRKHLEKCTPPKKQVSVDQIKQVFNPDFLRNLSQPQAQALERARGGENRSTFQCPYCTRANFTIEHLCKHMEKYHVNDNPCRVCPICASMPWGDKTRVSSNVFDHILSRHRFDYSTYVNYEQDEEAMMAEAMQRSMIQH